MIIKSYPCVKIWKGWKPDNEFDKEIYLCLLWRASTPPSQDIIPAWAFVLDSSWMIHPTLLSWYIHYINLSIGLANHCDSRGLRTWEDLWLLGREIGRLGCPTEIDMESFLVSLHFDKLTSKRNEE